MASEVKVLVKAENQTKTGFQAALNDAKKFGQEATKAATPGGGVGGGEVRKALKGLGGDLAQASTPAEALQAVVTRVAGAFGKITAVVGTFAVGKILAGQFEKLSTAVSNGAASLKEFSNIAEQTSNATTFESLVSGFDEMRSKIAQSKQSLKELKSDVGAVFANLVSSALTGRNAFSELSAAIGQMQSQATQALNTSAQNQLFTAENDLSAYLSGGKTGMEKERLRAKREEERRQLQEQLESTPVVNRGPVYDAIRANDDRYAAEDRLSQKILRDSQGGKQQDQSQKIYDEKMRGEFARMSDEEKLQYLRKRQFGVSGAVGKGNAQELAYYQIGNEADALEKSIKEKAKTRREADKKERDSIQKQIQEQQKQNRESAMTPESRMQYEMQGLQDLAGFAGPEVELQRQQAIGRIMALQQQMSSGGSQGFQGSAGASAFQRIGFASNEFFDTRKTKDPAAETAKAVAELKKIHKALSSGEPLVLNPSSS